MKKEKEKEAFKHLESPSAIIIITRTASSCERGPSLPRDSGSGVVVRGAGPSLHGIRGCKVFECAMFGVGVIGPNAFSLLFVVLVPPMDDIRKTVFDRKMQLNVPNKWMSSF